MHTVEMLNQALDLAVRLGYTVRQEWLAGGWRGRLRIEGPKAPLSSISISAPDEQLEQVLGVLRHEPDAVTLPMPHELRELLKVPKIA